MTSFAERFRRGDRLLGALVRMPNEGLVELAGLVGLDYVLLDTEHGPGDQLALTHHIVTAQANGLAVIVRVGRPAEVLRVLDLGAHGILAPHVSGVDQARAYIDATHYPPLGRRGFAAYTRAGNYGLRSATEHLSASRDTILVTMIEDPAGLAAAGSISALDGVDGLMLGPADLACELGAVGQPDDPRIVDAIETVREHARAAGVAAVMIVGSIDAVGRAFDAGDTAVMYNVQLLLGELFTRLAGVSRPRAAAAGVPEPLVLLPGMLGDGTVWDAVATHLCDVASPRLHRIDLDDSVAEMAKSVLAVAPDRFALAGHSLGAIVALEVVRRAPERVTRLALVNASGCGPAPEQQAAWSALLERLDGGGFDGIVTQLARLTLPATRREDTALVAAGERMARAVGPEGLRRQLRAQLARTSYLDTVTAIDVPMLIVSGALDEVCPPERQAELQARFPRARLVTLEDAGHITPLETPAALAAALRHWMTE
jgi:4-hydroxy-2-oxoheptanedioate aldolase